MSIFSELQRRNVWRVALLYVVVSWLTSLRFVALLLILGFPLALLFSWIYELTPEGLKRERDVDRSRSIVDTTGRRLNVVIVVLLMLAIAGLAYDRLSPESPSSAEEISVSDAQPGLSRPHSAAPHDGKPHSLSIAVLPFELRSTESDVGIFALAVADQLRVLLSADKRLKVTGSISSDTAAKRQLDVPGLRKQLGVEYVVFGSATVVQKRLQVQAELIGTLDGFTVWSRSYERPAEDLFGMPEDIANAVIATITNEPEQARSAVPSDNRAIDPEAYRAYLLGTHFLDRDGSVADYERAASEFKRVVELVPDYAVGWSRLARAHLGIGSRNANVDNSFQSSRIAAERAIALAPEMSEAWAVLAAIKISTGVDITGAYVAVGRAMSLNPNTEYATRLAGLLEGTFGHADVAAQLSLQAAAIDPLSTKTLRNAALYALYADEFDQAIEYGTRALDINEGAVVVPYILSRAYAGRGDIADALAIIEQEPITPFREFGMAYIYLADQDIERATAQINYLTEQYGDIAAVNLAELHGMDGNRDKAFAWLETAIENKDNGLFEARSMPGLRPLHDDPRWQDFIVKAGLEDPP